MIFSFLSPSIWKNRSFLSPPAAMSILPEGWNLTATSSKIKPIFQSYECVEFWQMYNWNLRWSIRAVWAKVYQLLGHWKAQQHWHPCIAWQPVCSVARHLSEWRYSVRQLSEFTNRSNEGSSQSSLSTETWCFLLSETQIIPVEKL